MFHKGNIFRIENLARKFGNFSEYLKDTNFVVYRRSGRSEMIGQ
jgi:hypothetical protein